MTRIDCIAAPADMLARLRLCRVLVGTGIRLQLVRSTQRHDHSPVIAVFQRDKSGNSACTCRPPCGHTEWTLLTSLKSLNVETVLGKEKEKEKEEEKEEEKEKEREKESKI